MLESGFPGISYEGAVDDSRIGIVHGEQLEADLAGKLIAVVAPIRISRAGSKRLASKDLLISIAAEVRLFLKKQPIFATQKVSGREARRAATDNHYVGLVRRVRTIKLVAVADLVADLEVISVNDGM